MNFVERIDVPFASIVVVVRRVFIRTITFLPLWRRRRRYLRTCSWRPTVMIAKPVTRWRPMSPLWPRHDALQRDCDWLSPISGL